MRKMEYVAFYNTSGQEQRRVHWWRSFAQEGRWSLSWAWLVPPLIVVLIVLFSFLTFVPQKSGTPGSNASSEGQMNTPVTPGATASSEGQADAPTVSAIATPSAGQPGASSTSVNAKPEVGPDYMAAMRENLELYLPLAGILLVIPLLARDWQHGALVQLALHKPLLRVLFERLMYSIIYLLIVTATAALVSLSLTSATIVHDPPFQWLGEVLLTVLPPTLFLIALGLLMTHATVSSIAGYIIALAPWLANRVYAQLVGNAHEKNALLEYLLTGWKDRDLVPDSSIWWLGKVLLLVGAIALFLLQIPVLQNEARLIRNMKE